MSLSNEIITHQLDPVLFDQRRCEFRLDPKVYLSNWRLADLGIKVSGGNQDHTTKHRNTRFATNLGAYAIIDRIRLLNGSVEIAELRNVNQFLAFNNLQRTNANAFNVNRTLNKSSFALDVESDASAVPRMQLKKYNEMDTTLTTDANTPLSYLDLTQVIPFLKAQSYVLGTELQSLRLVIEFLPPTTANINKIILSDDTPVTAYEILKPTLIIDELADSTAASKLKNKPITYINMDHEVVNVSANTTTINQRLRAFDDKLVRRMLMLNEDVNNTIPSKYFGGLTSYAMYKQKLQFSLNGGKLFPYNGIEDENQQLAMLNDTWGTHILPQGAQMFDLRHKPSLYAYQTSDQKLYAEAGNLVSQMSYAGFQVNQKIDELQLEYQRSVFTPVAATVITAISADADAVITAAGHGLVTGDVIIVKGTTPGTLNLNGQHMVTIDNINTFKTIPAFDNTQTAVAPNGGSVTLYNSERKAARSKAQCNLLFWGEVVKTMSVSNNNVKISNN